MNNLRVKLISVYSYTYVLVYYILIKDTVVSHYIQAFILKLQTHAQSFNEDTLTRHNNFGRLEICKNIKNQHKTFFDSKPLEY
ncbi:unnamed protein product [Callosobruchus maculatus]|uniref:Uncharacterized protein n=1 Tax=Callosobruchus maculatus TaxID=64391 RepID=A0A653DJ65_CALMS|nr:unnamed protein product [Callosobruchus maculatus]